MMGDDARDFTYVVPKPRDPQALHAMRTVRELITAGLASERGDDERALFEQRIVETLKPAFSAENPTNELADLFVGAMWLAISIVANIENPEDLELAARVNFWEAFSLAFEQRFG